MTLSSRHRIRNSGPGGLRPSTLPLGHGGSPQYWLSHVDGEETIFASFKPPRPGTEPRTLAWKAAVLTTTLRPRPSWLQLEGVNDYKYISQNLNVNPPPPPMSMIISMVGLTPDSAGIDFSCQNLTSVDVRFWRLKSRRQIHTTKVNPRTVTINIFLMSVDPQQIFKWIRKS